MLYNMSNILKDKRTVRLCENSWVILGHRFKGGF